MDDAADVSGGDVGGGDISVDVSSDAGSNIGSDFSGDFASDSSSEFASDAGVDLSNDCSGGDSVEASDWGADIGSDVGQDLNDIAENEEYTDEVLTNDTNSNYPDGEDLNANMEGDFVDDPSDAGDATVDELETTSDGDNGIDSDGLTDETSEPNVLPYPMPKPHKAVTGAKHFGLACAVI